MKIRDGLYTTKIGDNFFLVDSGSNAGKGGNSFSGMLKLNKTANFIVEKFRENTTSEDVAKAICEHYENVTIETATQNVEKVVEMLKKYDLFE